MFRLPLEFSTKVSTSSTFTETLARLDVEDVDDEDVEGDDEDVDDEDVDVEGDDEDFDIDADVDVDNEDVDNEDVDDEDDAEGDDDEGDVEDEQISTTVSIEVSVNVKTNKLCETKLCLKRTSLAKTLVSVVRLDFDLRSLIIS